MRLISTKTKEYFFGSQLCIRSIGASKLLLGIPAIRGLGVIHQIPGTMHSVYTHSTMDFSSETRFMIANPVVVKGTSPAPTSSLSGFDSVTPYGRILASQILGLLCQHTKSTLLS